MLDGLHGIAAGGGRSVAGLGGMSGAGWMPLVMQRFPRLRWMGEVRLLYGAWAGELGTEW